MIVSLDTLPAHLSSHCSHTLLHTILPFSTNSIPTLVDSGATDNFIDEFLAVLTPQDLWHHSTPILLKLFDGNPTSTKDITHFLPTLVNNRACGTFASNQLNLLHNIFDKPLKLQLFDGSPALTRITQYYDSTLTINNKLRFQLQDVNSNINWKDLSMWFPGPKASHAAAIPLYLQPPLTSDVPNLDSSSSKATNSPQPSRISKEGRKVYLCPSLP
ncbi:hypothetical protein E4T56_gene1564 [Termitomyces sp. T112]|nr:hypothetical protein E4T56_gene1564 [Termitomyces sp. T112]